MRRHRPGVPPWVTAAAGVAQAVGALVFPSATEAEANAAAELTAGYTDNLLRQPDGEDEVPVSLGLAGNWKKSTRHLIADVEGRVDGITYLNNTFDDEVFGQLDASATWWPAPERFSWVLENVYGQVASDPFAPMSPENRQNTNVLSTGPDWFIPMGDRTRLHLGGRYGSVQYEESVDDNTRLNGMAGIDRAISSSSQLGLGLNSVWVDYDAAAVLQADYDRHEAFASYEFTGEQETAFGVNAGYTWLSRDADDSSAPFLEVSLSRSVSPSTTLRLNLANRFSDPGDQFAAGGLPGSAPGTDPGVIPQAGVFEERSGRAVIDFQRERTSLSFAVEIADELYETADRRRYQALLTAERRMTRRLTGRAEIIWLRNEYEFDGLDRSDTDTEYRLELRRDLGERTSIGVVAQHASRASDDPVNEFDETRGYLVLSYALR